MRMTVTRGSMNLSQKDGGLPPDSVVQDEDDILADSERVLKLFHDPKPGADIRIALAPCSPFSINERLMRDSAALAERYDCQLHTHLCETADEERFCLEVYGRRPVDLLEETGWMSKRTWLAHGIHFNAEEIARLGKAGVGVGHCAASNMVLASGICPTCELERAGLAGRPRRRRLGLQRFVQHDGGGAARADDRAAALRRLGDHAHDVLRWATEGSARCLGRDDIGKIEVGREADLALFTLDEPRFSGAHDPLAALVLCGAHQADRVMIAGRWRVVDGAPVDFDLRRLARRPPRRRARLRLRRFALLIWILLIVGAFWAGAQNALAGGGSFITLPALMLTGIDARCRQHHLDRRAVSRPDRDGAHWPQGHRPRRRACRCGR